MDRRLLLVPASALFAHAQSSPEAVDAERALRQRVEEFYKLQQDKKFRQAEDYVAEESKDDYYNARKQVVNDFHVEKIVLTDDNTKANVTVKTKVVVLFAGVQEFDMRNETTWKIDNGKWCWYLDPATKNLTPFGRMETFDNAGVPDIKGLDKTGEAPDLNEILKKISIDRTVVAFTGNALSQSVTITNGTLGPLTLALDPHVAKIAGLNTEIDKLNLDGGQKATVTLKWDGSTPIENDVVYVGVDPYQRGFNIRVSAK
jgi:hypothetical protein